MDGYSDQLHDLIKRDPAAGGREAAEKIVNDVRAITDKISGYMCRTARMCSIVDTEADPFCRQVAYSVD